MLSIIGKLKPAGFFGRCGKEEEGEFSEIPICQRNQLLRIKTGAGEALMSVIGGHANASVPEAASGSS